MSTYINSTKIDLTPRRHHGYAVLLFIMGTLFPPLAVAARFGIGKDFWLNLLLTICGYIPGHGHNFYIQNIRNNKNHRRTPKWAQRYGLVDTSEIKRKERKSQWAYRYNDRLPESTLEGQPYEEGEVAGSSTSLPAEGQRRKQRKQSNDELWRPEDEAYYNPDRDNNSTNSSGGRWHYPANFDDTIPDETSKKSRKKKKEKEKKDRWARTEDAYSMSEGQGSKRKKSKKKKRQSSAVDETTSTHSDSATEFPEDPEGGLYGDRPGRTAEATAPKENGRTTDEELFNHQF